MTRFYMLDTDTVSYIFKGVSAAARRRLVQLGAGEAAFILSITEAELW
jgi:predicted nucleic acid-binding protein